MKKLRVRAKQHVQGQTAVSGRVRPWTHVFWLLGQRFHQAMLTDWLNPPDVWNFQHQTQRSFSVDTSCFCLYSLQIPPFGHLHLIKIMWAAVTNKSSNAWCFKHDRMFTVDVPVWWAAFLQLVKIQGPGSFHCVHLPSSTHGLQSWLGGLDGPRSNTYYFSSLSIT